MFDIDMVNDMIDMDKNVVYVVFRILNWFSFGYSHELITPYWVKLS